MRAAIIVVLCILSALASISGFHHISPPVRSKSQLQASFWGNYKSNGKTEGKIGLALAVALCIKGNFMSVDVRTTYTCPSGANSEKTLASLIRQEPTYKCLPPNELFVKFLTAPLVFPGNPEYDPQFIRIEMIGAKPQSIPKQP